MKKTTKAIPDDWTFTERIDGFTFVDELDQLIPPIPPYDYGRSITMAPSEWRDLFSAVDTKALAAWHERTVGLKFKYADLP